MKLHKTFSENQKTDPFVLDYFNYLGHHEFGLDHKPFMLTDSFMENREKYELHDLNYWLLVWINYYEYLLDNFDENFLVISFEDLVSEPNKVFDHVKARLSITSPMTSDKKHTPSSYSEIDCDQQILGHAQDIYQKLCALKKYEV
jgi:hypothetical protein